MFKIVRLSLVALTLAACTSAPEYRPPPRPAGPAAQEPSPGRANAYRIDPTQSELRVLVYRAGPLARFGHNHVMVNRALHGDVSLERNLDESSFTVLAPVAAFTVDDVEARHEEGPDFAAEVSDDAKTGTFRNMTGAALLNAPDFPDITVKSGAIQDRVLGADAARAPPTTGPKTVRNEVLATVTVTVRGRDTTLQVPVEVLVDSGRVVATGVMELKQTTLGLTPFSLMMGALQVEDAITVKFRIVATSI